jgi:hypothetical protein
MSETYPLSAESKALIKRMLEERNAAQDRLDIAVMATKAAVGAPMEYDIKSLDVGFEAKNDFKEVDNGGDNRPGDS